jgi:3-oxoacyl-[acyl-carrier-protein] synthase III
MSEPIKPGIIDAAYYLPGAPVDLCAWALHEGVRPDRVARLLDNGCRYFHVADGESDADLVTRAIERLQAGGRADPGAADFVLHARSQAFSAPPAPESILATVCARFGMRPRLALAVEQLACGGVINAVDLALRLLAADPSARTALVITSDRVFGPAKYRLRQDAGIQSDGGSAILLGREGWRARIDAVHVRNHDQMYEGPGTPERAARVSMLAWSQTRRMVADDIERSGFGVDGFAAFLPTNADGPYWRKIAPMLGISDEQLFLENMRQRGHSCCSDLAINLVDEGFAKLANGPVLAFSQSNVGAYGSMILGAPL